MMRTKIRYCALGAILALSAKSPQLAMAQASVNCAYFENIVNVSGSRPRQSNQFTTENTQTVYNTAQARQAFIDPTIKTIVFAPGQYRLGSLTINRTLNLYSEFSGAAIFPRGTLFDIRAPNTIIDGFRFEDGAKVSAQNSRDHSLYIRADDVTLKHNTFYQIGIGSTIADKTGIAIEIINSKNTVITDNTFNSMRGVAIKTDDHSRNIVIAHNNFLNSYAYGGVGEIAHIGNANTAQNGASPVPDAVQAKIVHNYIKDWQLESELVSIKSNKNEVAYNVVENASSGAFVVRMGHDNHIHSNVVNRNKIYPLRISGQNNIFQYNYFSGQGAILALHKSVPTQNPQPNLHFDYLQAQNNRIQQNVFTGYTDIVGAKDNPLMQSNLSNGNKFLNNIIVSPYPHQIYQALQTARSSKSVENYIQSDAQQFCPSLFDIEK